MEQHGLDVMGWKSHAKGKGWEKDLNGMEKYGKVWKSMEKYGKKDGKEMEKGWERDGKGMGEEQKCTGWDRMGHDNLRQDWMGCIDKGQEKIEKKGNFDLRMMFCTDQVMMISYMIDGQGYLICNRNLPDRDPKL